MHLIDITLAYGRKVVAQIDRAELLPGELVCLVGRNGTGKSTLIRSLCDSRQPSHFAPSLGRAGGGAHVAVVLTDRIDIDRMTMRQVVGMGRMPYTGFFGTLSKEDDRIVDEAMLTLGIADMAEQMINTLSDGERQKAMIAKALAQETPYILLDEPTAFLDYPSKVSVMQILSQLAHEKQKAILISTHDLDVALRYCDKVWWLTREEGSVSRLKEMKASEFSLENL